MKLRARQRWRIGLTIATAIVLSISAASCVVGVFVYQHDGSYRESAFSLAQATVSATYADRSSWASLMSRMPAKGWRWETSTSIGKPLWNWTALWTTQSAPFPSWAVRVPLWIVLALLGAPCGWMWLKHLKRTTGGCAHCGYDLRGLTGNTCPECGHTSQSVKGIIP